MLHLKYPIRNRRTHGRLSWQHSHSTKCHYHYGNNVEILTFQHSRCTERKTHRVFSPSSSPTRNMPFYSFTFRRDGGLGRRTRKSHNLLTAVAVESISSLPKFVCLSQLSACTRDSTRLRMMVHATGVVGAFSPSLCAVPCDLLCSTNLTENLYPWVERQKRSNSLLGTGSYVRPPNKSTRQVLLTVVRSSHTCTGASISHRC